MKVSSARTKYLVRPFRFSELEDVDVLPYVRHRLVFAHLAAKILKENKYDVLLVDLPRFMNDPYWLTVPLKLFPQVSLAVFERSDGGFRTIVLAPNDAACLGVYLARTTSLSCRCLDDSDLLNYPPDAIFSPLLRMGDDYQAIHLGLGRYFQPLWDQMDVAWAGAPAPQRFFTRYRAGEVIKSLKASRQPGRKTLLVCEYQLWWALRQLLQEEPKHQVRYLFKWENAPGILRVEDPHAAWVHGLIDDYPAVNLHFWHCLNSGDPGSFDKLAAFEGILERVMTGKEPKPLNQAHGGKVIRFEQYLKKLGRKIVDRETQEKVRVSGISVRGMISFLRYLKKLTISHQRFLPMPGEQLFHAAEACGGTVFHKHLAREFMSYPRELTGKQVNLILEQGGVVVLGGPGLDLTGDDYLPSFFTGRPYSFHEPEGQDNGLGGNLEMEARQRAVDFIHPQITAEEKQELTQDEDYSFIEWVVIEDYKHHALACERVRSLVTSQMNHFVPKRSWGSMKGGIHWKATLGAMARGEDAIFVKYRTINASKSMRLDEHTPIVFLLASPEEIDNSVGLCIYDGNPARRHLDMGYGELNPSQDAKPDMVFSVFITSKERINLYEGKVIQRNLTSIALLYTKHFMGVERYNAITRREKSYQCRLHPSADFELWDFPLSQRGIAWALKYAPSVVLVAAAPGWQVPEKLSDLARRKGKQLQFVNLTSFRPDFLDRLGRIFLLSTSLKRHRRHEEIARRFIH
jgi:hypothetical protein